MDSLLCWRPRYHRLQQQDDRGLNNQIQQCLQETTTNNKINNNINIIKNINNTPRKIVEPSAMIDPMTKSSSWFLPKISRSKAEEILSPASVGSFLLRCSSCPSSAFALSVRVEDERVQHHLLLLSNRGVVLNGSNKVFPNLGSLVTHLSIMKEELPCCLVLEEGTKDEEEEDEQDVVDIDSDKEIEDCVNNLKMRLVE